MGEKSVCHSVKDKKCYLTYRERETFFVTHSFEIQGNLRIFAKREMQGYEENDERRVT